MKIGLKKIIPLFFISTVCAVFLRVLQITQMTESKTGFFIKEYELIGIAVTIVIFVIAAICTIYAALYKEKEVNPITVTKPFAVIHFILALAIVYESLFSPVSGAIHTWQVLLQMVFGLLSAIVFIYRGYITFTGGTIQPITSLSHVIFWLIRVIIVFAASITASTIAENIFEMAALCTALVFFLNASALENGIEPVRIKKKILPSSIAAFILGAVYSASQLVVMLSGKTNLLHNIKATFFTNAILVVYILYYILLCFKTPKEENENEQIEIDE